MTKDFRCVEPDRPSPPAEPKPLTDDEKGELARLREKDYLHSLGDRPSSMAAADIRRIMELEAKPAEPKCERCNHPAHWNRCDCGCYYRPPTPEPAESEGSDWLCECAHLRDQFHDGGPEACC